MLNILSHKGDTNQNYTEIQSHPSQNGSHQENKQECGGRRILMHCCWGCKLVQPPWKSV
jgi:hypothetical protein